MLWLLLVSLGLEGEFDVFASLPLYCPILCISVFDEPVDFIWEYSKLCFVVAKKGHVN